ncbi:MAG: ABC-2 family transporter protein [Armatimonadaceae bacterium]
MRDTIQLYIAYMRASLRGQMQYRASFLMWTLAQGGGIGIEFLGIWALFDRFGSIRDWTLAEIALLFGMVNVAFALAESFGRGFDMFAGMVRTGDFDRLLLRPRSTALQVAGQEFQFLRIGRLMVGLTALIWATLTLDILWTLPKVLLLIASVIGGACVFYGLFVLQATLCFWTVESLEIMNTVTYGGTETAQYPLTIYRDWFRRFFTFVVPLACVNYIPVSALLDRGQVLGVSAVAQWTAPLIGFVFLIVCLQIWRIGERRYTSTGS